MFRAGVARGSQEHIQLKQQPNLKVQESKNGSYFKNYANLNVNLNSNLNASLNANWNANAS